MSQLSVSEALSYLDSDKIRERQDALSFIKERFDDDLAEDKKRFPQIIAGLFTCVNREKSLYHKKPTAVAERRLAETASTIRFVVEKAGHRFRSQADLWTFIDKCLSVMVSRRELCQPIALDMLKSLTMVVNVLHNLENLLFMGKWQRVVEFGFNVLLGDNPGDTFEGNAYSDHEDTQNESEEETYASQSPLNKRRRASPTRNSPSKRRKIVKSTRRPIITSPSREQVQAASLLLALLRPSAVNFHIIRRGEPPEAEKIVAPAILRRLTVFLEVYTSDSSLHYDYLQILLATLSHLALNVREHIIEFASKSWGRLLALWGTKNKHLKEGLVSVLHVLFPYVIASIRDEPGAADKWIDEVQRSWAKMHTEGSTKWTPLFLDALRLDFTNIEKSDDGDDGAFLAGAFRAGHNFTQPQALAWAILKFQADCAAKLYDLRESSASYGQERVRIGGTHRDPINKLLSSLRSDEMVSSSTRIYELQLLLFIVDFHWSVLHSELQESVINVLGGIILSNVADASILSWSCICIASVAHADRRQSRSTSSSALDRPAWTSIVATWDSIWANVVRRANVSSVCRAACHAARSLLLHIDVHSSQFPSPPLNKSRVLSDIEALVKDLDVQGPTYPYDSICFFLAHCLQSTSRDIRLHRMQLEDKVLTWLVECWKLARVEGDSLPGCAVKDVLFLLEIVCAFTRQSDVVCTFVLPTCQIVDTVEQENYTTIIRDYVLHAELPPFHPDGIATKEATASADGPLTEPGHRQRRLSVFMLQSLEAISASWTLDPKDSKPSAVAVRKALDMAVIAIAFQGLLVYNGVRGDTLVAKTAGKVITQLIAWTQVAWWTPLEKAVVLAALDPLISTGDPSSDEEPFVDLVPPTIMSGIKSEILHTLESHKREKMAQRRSSRMNFQRIMWRNLEEQHIRDIQGTTRSILQTLSLGICVADRRSNPNAMDVDAEDDFGTIRTGFAQPQNTQQDFSDLRSARIMAHMSMTALTRIPVLLDALNAPARDKELVDMVLDCSRKHMQPQTFFFLSSVLFEQFRSKSLYVSNDTIVHFITELSKYWKQYHYRHTDTYLRLIPQFFDSVFDEWVLQDAPAEAQILSKVFTFLQADGIPSWKARDALCRLLSRFLVDDPHLRAWPTGTDLRPDTVMIQMNADLDTRVRFRMAVLSTSLVSFAQTTGADTVDFFRDVREALTTHLSDYDEISTRMLYLANIVIISSETRRGSYWNVLEVSLVDSDLRQEYERLIAVVLSRASQRLGLASTASFFEAYGSQIALSLLMGGTTIDKFPAHLLGYKDSKEFALAAFPSFTPVNLTVTPEVGRGLFTAHCQLIGKPPIDGIMECFGDIVGQRLLTVDLNDRDGALAELMTTTCTDQATFEKLVRSKVDALFTCVVRAIDDYDVSSEGTMATCLSEFDRGTGTMRTVFDHLVAQRRLNPCVLQTHEPNLPRADTARILHIFDWLGGWVQVNDAYALTYHVLQALFAQMEKSVMVNEQIRLLNATCIWITYRHENFDDPTLLHVLMRGASSLLYHPDLARGAQSILAWSFEKYRSNSSTVKDPRFPDILIRICHLAHEYYTSSNPSLRALGHDLSDWIDTETCLASRIDDLEDQIMLALVAWSRNLHGELDTFYGRITSPWMSRLLKGTNVTINKFRVAVSLRDLMRKEEYDQSNFSTDFWMLKDSIPSSISLDQEDVRAFADLLMWNKGRIDGLVTRRSDTSKKSDAVPENVIINILLDMMGSGDVARRHVAYTALRSVVGIRHDLRGSVTYGEEIPYLQVYPIPPTIRPNAALQDLIVSDKFISSAATFNTWISTIACHLADMAARNDDMATQDDDLVTQDDIFYSQLSPIISIDPKFGREVLPVLVQVLLQRDTTASRQCSNVLTSYFTSVLSSKTVDDSCVRSIIDIVLHLRTLPQTRTEDPLSYDKWLDIDYILLARCSIRCGSYTTALLFLELAVEYAEDAMSQATVVEEVMYDIYSNIDEPDGFYGIQPTDMRRFLLNRFHHEHQWDKAFRFHGAALEAGNTDPIHAHGLMKSLGAFGFDHQASQVMLGGGVLSTQSAMNYKLGWRTSTWDVPDGEGHESSEASLYFALRALHVERDIGAANTSLQRSLSQEMARLRDLGSENLNQIREVLRNLLCLHQIAQWLREPFSSLLKTRNTDIANWESFCKLDSTFDFETAESIIATRLSIIQAARKREDRLRIGQLDTPFSVTLRELEKRSLLHVSEMARHEGQVQNALNSVIRAEELEKTATLDVSEEFANVLWAHNEERRAVDLLRQIRDSGRYDAKLALVNARLGSWTAKACLEKPSIIWNEYLSTAIQSIHASSLDQNANAAVYQTCAQFAESQYYLISRSPDNVRYSLYIRRREAQINDRKEGRSQSTRGQKQKDTPEAILDRDKRKLQQSQNDSNSFLSRAIDMYARCLELSDDFDDEAVIRLCSLWLANFTEDSISDTVDFSLCRVPSRKFVFLAHQLVARLSTVDPDKHDGQKSLHKLVTRMCSEHPFHAVYQLLCIADNSLQKTQPPRARSTGPASNRRYAAANICETISTTGHQKDRVRDLRHMRDSAIQWATFAIAKNAAYRTPGVKKFEIPKEQSISLLGHEQVARRRSQNFVRLAIPVMTAHEPIDRTTRYDSCAWLDRYDSHFTLAGGVNLPKIVTCYDDTGKTYKQLFKGEGNDDLRQDAVMEQVFDIVNTILHRDTQTKRRKLTVRDYKVIPLNSGSGVLEFVDKTTPMRHWLAVAHKRYSKVKLEPLMTRLKSVQGEYIHTPEMIEKFEEMCRGCPPVMRHFFTEHHKDPMSWFTMRLNYTRSVATTSIVGHILGLGDRHTSNILLDNHTGEVVHIDLGIAFEQGKRLAVPERVPFRMTSNIVDGMGVSGTDGVFQRCAEETLRVLRDGRGVIMMILEVFRHDPLHSWITSEVRAGKAQPFDEKDVHWQSILANVHDLAITLDSDNAQETADRALSVVSSKLDPSLSVASTVSGLVAEARDPELLANMYHGWLPVI